MMEEKERRSRLVSLEKTPPLQELGKIKTTSQHEKNRDAPGLVLFCDPTQPVPSSSPAHKVQFHATMQPTNQPFPVPGIYRKTRKIRQDPLMIV